MFSNISKLSPVLANKIFDMTISPILIYNSEIWGVYVNPDFKSWDSSQIEKTHLQFCKRYLEVRNKASNMACRAELGRFPLNIAINQKINKSKIKHYISLMQHKYILHGQHTIQHSTKLEFYNTFKNEYAPSCYLELTSKLNERKELVKFRIGNHKLMIETGRYSQIPRVNRLCPTC